MMKIPRQYRTLTLALSFFTLCSMNVQAQPGARAEMLASVSPVASGAMKHLSTTTGGSIDKAKIAADIKSEFLLCWNSYVKYAWGYDQLDPLKKKGENWYSVSFYMTPVDAMDTMILMGLRQQADSARALVDSHLNFDQDVYVSTFEFTIRFIGGLLSSYEMTGDKRLLALAKDLADRELAAFKSPTGMPYGEVNLTSSKLRVDGGENSK